ncbi:MAG: hypothetical protein OES38_08140 [Gammaproteobacteria bacterium]|nr:hypothetical protein [Gammaproteobacteria bacterium]
MMDEAYRLLFRGEVLDGQHPAVVKKRLVDALQLNDDQAAKLFSGSAVILKRNADTKTAARYQGLFKKAGARLRVMPVEESKPKPAPISDPASAAASVESPQPAAAEASARAATDAAIEVLPAGADMLSGDERHEIPAVEVDISHLDILEDAPAAVAEVPAQAAVNVPEFSIADLGVDMVEHIEAEPADIDPHFDLAELGADIPTLPVDSTPVIDIASVRFDVAERGADIGDRHNESHEPAPDTSHLSLVAE